MSKLRREASSGAISLADVLHGVLLRAERGDAGGGDRERQRLVHRDLHLTALPLGGRIVDLRQRVAPEPVRAEDDEVVPRHAHDDRAGPQRRLGRGEARADESPGGRARPRSRHRLMRDHPVQERCPASGVRVGLSAGRGPSAGVTASRPGDDCQPAGRQGAIAAGPCREFRYARSMAPAEGRAHGPRGRRGARSRSRTRGRSTSPRRGITKLDVVQYYLAVAEGALRGAGGRPNVLVRYADGIHGEFFYQKRAPTRAPGLDRGRRRSRSRRAAPRRRSCRATPRRSPGWRTSAASSSTRTRCAPRTSTIPTSCASTSTRCRASRGRRSWTSRGVVREVLDELGLVGWPKTSGSRGIHVNVRIHPPLVASPRCGAPRSRSRARSSGARPTLATSKWWKEERHGVFLDYNQNAKDRTVASAYSVRPEAGRARLGAGHVGRARRVRPERLHARARCRRASPRSATGTPRIDDAPRLARRAARAVRARRRRRAWATRPGRRTTRSSRASRRGSRRRGGRAAASAERPPRLDEAARRDRPRRQEGGRARRARALEGAPPRGRRRTSSPRTSWSTRCAAAPRPGPASA